MTHAMIEMPPLQYAQVNGIRMGFYEAGPKTGKPPVVLSELLSKSEVLSALGPL